MQTYYIGNGKVTEGGRDREATREELIEFLRAGSEDRARDTENHRQMIEKIRAFSHEEVKKLEEKLKVAKIELATYFRKSVENNETECRNIEVVLREEKKYETDFLVVVYDFPVDAPNEIGWSTNVTSPTSAIAGVRMYNGGWGFVSLNNYEKQAIGKFFDACNLQRGKYYWCSMSYYPDSAIVVK